MVTEVHDTEIKTGVLLGDIGGDVDPPHRKFGLAGLSAVVVPAGGLITAGCTGRNYKNVVELQYGKHHKIYTCITRYQTPAALFGTQIDT